MHIIIYIYNYYIYTPQSPNKARLVLTTRVEIVPIFLGRVVYMQTCSSCGNLLSRSAWETCLTLMVPQSPRWELTT